NSDQLVRLKTELADVDRELESSFEHLAGVKREIEALENDTRATQVRFELRQLEDQLRSRAREWMVCTTATQTIDELRRDFERSHQPLALAEAGRIFSRLTCGKYLRVWTPLGERRLVVSDALGNSFPIQSLSRSTREQLLLAVRLAVVVELGRQGIELPLILDDVLVNFDEERARAAADVLMELGDQGHQILFFTCHSHLTQLFADRGVEPIELPHQPHLLLERDESSRLAG
ncbi:MAG: hypothetical protein JSS02_11835, partial [Planctomycetes bacterium]|nr:hypothetical protein [Planctomycetota bacterium]